MSNPNRLLRNADQRLAYGLRKELQRISLTGDTYDGDYIVGWMMEWLSKESLVLTAAGLKRLTSGARRDDSR